MNLVISAHSNKDESVLQPIVGRFDERGGTIGRSETNTLTLPDPNRHISRLQAEVAFSGGTFSIRNVGSANAVLIGGRLVGPGESVAMGQGDELVIGSYVLQVSVGGAGDTTAPGARQAIDPRSVIKASLKESRTNPRLRAEGAPAAAVEALAPVPPAANPGVDANPFADLFAAATPGVDPFADLLGGAAPARPVPRVVAAQRPREDPPRAPVAASATSPAKTPAARLPDDFDPFAELPQPRPAPPTAPPSAGPADFSDVLGPATASASLDRAFGLGPSGQADPLSDFLAGATPESTPGKTIGSDPLALFGATEQQETAPGLPAAFDHVPELQAAYAPPAVQAVQAVQATIRPPSSQATETAPTDHTPATGMPSRAAVPAPAAGLDPATKSAEAAANDVLWRAFCEGAGIAPGDARQLDAQLMRQLGQVLQHAVAGALRLIAVRAAVKQELHADVTMIQSQHNNPLKFSPDAPAAIEQLLRAPLRGFMPGPLAMQDAMADLLGHAMGTMAGMRAALQGVLQRFEPAQLEHKLGAHKVMDALLPMNRRAKLWEQYLLHFERIRNDAQEDFHELFGKAFVEAYEEQLGKLKSERH